MKNILKNLKLNKRFFSAYDSSIKYQTFVLSCDGAMGDVIHITDRILQDDQTIGHAISEIYIFGPEFAIGNSVDLIKFGMK